MQTERIEAIAKAVIIYYKNKNQYGYYNSVVKDTADQINAEALLHQHDEYNGDDIKLSDISKTIINILNRDKDKKNSLIKYLKIDTGKKNIDDDDTDEKDPIIVGHKQQKPSSRRPITNGPLQRTPPPPSPWHSSSLKPPPIFLNAVHVPGKTRLDKLIEALETLQPSEGKKKDSMDEMDEESEEKKESEEDMDEAESMDKGTNIVDAIINSLPEESQNFLNTNELKTETKTETETESSYHTTSQASIDKTAEQIVAGIDPNSPGLTYFSQEAEVETLQQSQSQSQSQRSESQVDLDAQLTEALVQISGTMLDVGETVVPPAINVIGHFIQFTGNTLVFANKNMYTRTIFILLIMAARHNSSASKVVIDAFGTVLGKALGFVYHATGMPVYVESILDWANSLVDALMYKITTPIIEAIDGAKEAIGNMLKEFAEDVMVILKELPAGVAQAMALDALKKSFFERAFGATVSSAVTTTATATISGIATGMTRGAMNSIMDGIIRAGAQQTLTGGHSTNKRTRKSKPRLRRNKTNKHKKRTLRKHKKRQPKKRTRRIK